MSQPPQEPPTTPNNGETSASGSTCVQEVPTTTEEGDENVGSGEDLQARLGEADELKQEGNDLFRRGKWDEALQIYRNGLTLLPKRRNPPSSPPGSPHPPPATDDKGETLPAEGDANRNPTDAQNQQESTSADSPLERECAKARSVLNANIAACHVKLGANEDAVKVCTEALQDDPSYVRVLQRRAQCNEKIGSWSALSSAKEDYNTLITLLPPSSDQVAEVKRSLRLLEPRLEEAQKREVGEMVDKLKGLGNSVLGRFGLSTDNFKFEPNGQGGYSMNFSR